MPASLRATLALAALVALVSCGDDAVRTDTCVPSAADSCPCPDGRLGGMVCQPDMRWGPCMCRDEDAGADASMDATPDAAGDAAPDATVDATMLPDAGVMWPASPDAYTPGMVSRITSLTIPTPVDGVSDCCRDWGEISRDNRESGTDEVDNAFAALAEATVGLGLDIQMVLDAALTGETLNVLLDHQGFDGDPDPAFIVAALDGVPTAAPGTYQIDRASFLPGTGTPRSLFEPSALASGTLTAGPGAITLALPFAGVTLAYTFEDVRLSSAVDTSAGVAYTAGELSGYLKVDDYFGGINDYVASSCSCLGLTGPLYSRSGSMWTNQCIDEAEAMTRCPAASESGCREVSSGTDCTASPVIIPSLADLDTDASTAGYESLSLGLRFTAAPVTVTGVAP